MTTIQDVLDLIEKLTPTDKDELKSMLMDSPFAHEMELEEFVGDERFANDYVCPHCGATGNIKRYGHQKNGAQRFYCKDCKKTFVASSNSIASKTRKTLSVWMKYVDCMMNGYALQKTAEVCGISVSTAFRWRHKILDAMQDRADEVVFKGFGEFDETFLDVSYKGNHSKSEDFEMPREPHKRGHSSHQVGLSYEKVCIPCAVNRQGDAISKASNTGKVSAADLHSVFDGRIEEGSTIVSDKDKSYPRFAKDNGLKLIQVSTGEVKGGMYHIQNINNYHSRLKKFLATFNGVSTKYLNNYLVWNNFVNYEKKTAAEKRKILLSYVLTAYKTERCVDLSKRPAIPVAA